MDILLFSLNAVSPVIILIFIGFFLKKIGFLDDNFIKTGNKFCFKFSLPLLLFYNIYNIKSFAQIKWNIVIYSEIVIVVLFLIGIFSALFIKEPKQKGVIVQCFFRSNFALIGMPLALSLFGDEGGAVAALLSAFTIPTFNILAVIALTVFIKDNGKKTDIKKILIGIVKNPLILGVLFGLLVLGIRSFLPCDANGNHFTIKNSNIRFLYTVVEYIAKIASPFSLIILGGQFEFSAAKKYFKKITFGVFARNIVSPLIGIMPAYFLFPSFNGPEFASLVALFASPIAVSSAIMATQMDNDKDLAGQMVVWTSIMSAFSIFIVVAILRAVGKF